MTPLRPTRILFVDDEPAILDGLRRMLRPLRWQLDMTFAGSGSEALALCEAEPFEVVVSDLWMPGLDGLALLGAIKQRWPRTVRIILSGHSDRDAVMGTLGCAHQFLAKPCSPDELMAAVKRAAALRQLLWNDQLLQVTSRITALPSIPELYLRIHEVLSTGQSSIEDVGRIVAGDMAMSARVLQFVNSAFFGIGQRCTSAVDATVYLGLDTITALVLAAEVFSRASSLSGPILERMWSHCLRTGAFARSVAKLENLDARTAEQAFLAGMLHEVGHLVLSVDLVEELKRAWRQAGNEKIPVHQSEERILGASHAAVGAYLLGIWGFPDEIVEAIAFHHTPSKCQRQGFSIVTAVHVATALEAGLDSPISESEQDLDLGYLENLGLARRLPTWREACMAQRGAA